MKRNNPIVLAAIWAAAAAIGASAAAQTSSSAPPQRPAGIYLDSAGAGGTPVRLAGVITRDIEQKGLMKSMATGGFAKSDVLARIPGETASLRTSPEPVFYFYLGGPAAAPDPSSMDISAMMRAMQGDSFPSTINDPAQFALVRFAPKGGSREAVIGQAGRGSGGPKDKVACSIEKVAANVYRIRPKEPLGAGEYAFTVANQAMGGQFWDFGIDAK